MREINQIIIHCSATSPDQDIGVAEIREWHIKKGWRDIGYHYVIRQNGSWELGRDTDRDGNVDEEIGAHALGFNARSISICLVGGVDKDGNPDSNFTISQLFSLYSLVTTLKNRYNVEEILGHRDLPGVTKACPCFDVKTFFKYTV